MKVVTALQLLGQSLFASAEVRDYARYRLAKEMARRIYPKYVFSEHGRIWLNDADFFRDYFSFMPANNGHSADRKYLLKNLMRLVEGIPGDSAECGVFEGASSFVMCQQIRGTRKRHHLFDSFAGLSAPKSIDGDHWNKSDLRSAESRVRQRLAEFDFAVFHPGWIPSTFDEVSEVRFSFVHIDVDLHQPTIDSLSFFYPRMNSGGVIVCDDYGSAYCPGAKIACDDYMKGKPEKLVHCPTGQAFLIKDQGRLISGQDTK